MDPRKTIAAIASGLSVAVLAASILRDTRSLDTPPGADSFLQRHPRSAATRGSACREVYPDRFHNAIFNVSLNIACRPQLPTEGDCVESRKFRGTSCSHSGIGCRRNNKRKPLWRERSKVTECDLLLGSLHCWHKLTKHWFHQNKPRPMDNCIIIYPTLPSSPSPSPTMNTSPPPPPPTTPDSPPTPSPTINTSPPPPPPTTPDSPPTPSPTINTSPPLPPPTTPDSPPTPSPTINTSPPLPPPTAPDSPPTPSPTINTSPPLPPPTTPDSPPTPSPTINTSPPLPPLTTPDSPPTPSPSMSTASNQPHLITHPFIYAGGVPSLARILPRLAPLPSGTSSSYIYLACNSSRHYPEGFPLQNLIVVNFLRTSTSEPEGAGRSSSNTSHIKVTVLPSVSRAAFYRNYRLSTRTLQEMEEAQGAAILDFPMHQTSGLPKGITPFISEFLLQMSDHMTSDSIQGDKPAIFMTGISPCNNKSAAFRNGADGNSYYIEDHYTKDNMFSHAYNQAMAMDNFLCSAVHIQHSWWNSSELIDIQEINDQVTSLQVVLSEHISKRGEFPVSVSVIQHLEQQVVPSKLVPPGNDVNDDRLLSSQIQQLGGPMSNTIHVILSDGGTIYHPKSRYTSYTKIEESNPLLLFIIPQTTKLLMSKLYLKTLEVNCERLVTTADVALTVLSLTDMDISILAVSEDLSAAYTPHSLVLKELPVSRSCQSLGVQAPHVCICEGEWTPADNDTMYVGLAELAVASLNEVIRQQAGGSAATNGTHREAFYSSAPYATCLKLIGISFYDVQVRREEAMLVTRMSLIVAQKTLNVHAQGATPLTDSFQVTLGSDFSRQEVGEMRMLGYVRMSNIGGRRGCSVGTGVDPDLCLCVPGARRHIETPDSILHHLKLTQFGVRPKLLHLHHPCLILSIRQYGDSDSVTFTAVNTCDSYTYEVTLRVVAVSVILSQTNPNTAVIHPLCEVTLNVVMKVSYYTPSSKVGYQVSYTFMED